MDRRPGTNSIHGSRSAASSPTACWRSGALQPRNATDKFGLGSAGAEFPQSARSRCNLDDGWITRNDTKTSGSRCKLALPDQLEALFTVAQPQCA
jgi:hypothetical protein